jgi:hypothetical protein
MQKRFNTAKSARNSRSVRGPPIPVFLYAPHLADLVSFWSCAVKEKYGSDADTDDLTSGDSDSESDESEDEDGEELTPALDAAILRTLARIKARDPGIYNTSCNVFEGTAFLFPPLPLPAPVCLLFPCFS